MDAPDASNSAASATTGDSASSNVASQPRLSASDARIARYAELGLRLLGVMFIVEGAAGIIGSTAYVATLIAVHYRGGAAVFTTDPVYIGWLVSSALVLVPGICLVTNVRWLVELVFLPAEAPRTTDTKSDTLQTS